MTPTRAEDDTRAPTLCCPVCGSTDVQELCLVWHDANTHKPDPDGEAHLAEAYDELFWCNACSEHVSHLAVQQ
jgi:hypothetical protein